jgi:hypothetical protein
LRALARPRAIDGPSTRLAAPIPEVIMRASRPLVLLLVAAIPAPHAAAQELPAVQPRFLTIYQERVKPGRQGDHAANEAGWPAAFEKAGSPVFYLALDALTGPPEVWFAVPYASYAQEGEDLKRNRTDPTLAAELERLARADAEYLVEQNTIQAMARPELSVGAFPDLALVRYWEVTTFRVRPGHERGFEEAIRAYIAAADRLPTDESFRTYQVTAGMPGPAFLVFASVNDYAEFDRLLVHGEMVMRGLTSQERATIESFSRDGLLGVVTNRYRLDPRMSYVDGETRARDPDFWKGLR